MSSRITGHTNHHGASVQPVTRAKTVQALDGDSYFGRVQDEMVKVAAVTRTRRSEGIMESE